MWFTRTRGLKRIYTLKNKSINFSYLFLKFSMLRSTRQERGGFKTVLRYYHYIEDNYHYLKSPLRRIHLDVEYELSMIIRYQPNPFIMTTQNDRYKTIYHEISLLTVFCLFYVFHFFELYVYK